MEWEKEGEAKEGRTARRLGRPTNSTDQKLQISIDFNTFYGDRRTIFEFRRLSEKDKAIERDTHVQFRRMCEQLGIELITTSVSQAKGRIERLWGTLQSRLVSELRARGIKTIEEANAFLPEFTSD